MAERGQVLWFMVVLLAVLAELALTGLQSAASAGFAMQAEMRLWHQRQRAEAIVATLARQPLPSLRTMSADQPWSPLLAPGRSLMRQGTTSGRAAYVEVTMPGALSELPAPVAGSWSWLLRRLPDEAADSEEGTDLAAFPQRQPQRWQLDVLVRESAAPASGWRLHYRQQAAP